MTERRIEIEFIDASGNRGVFQVSEIVSVDGKAFTDETSRMELEDRMTYMEARLDTLERTLLAAMQLEATEEGE